MNKVSIIMPVYNAEKYISGSIHSVLNQTYTNWELIIIDDGSTDSTASLIKSFLEQDNRISYLYQQNKKQAAARNLGISKSSGDWIAFLDADDLWEPSKLDIQFGYVNKVESEVYFTGGDIIDQNDGFISGYDTVYGFYSGSEMYKKLVFRNPIPILSVLVKREWIEKAELHNEGLNSFCEDWNYWIKLALLEARFFGIDEKLFRYRIHPNGTSSKILQMKMGECHILCRNLDFNYFDKNEKVQVVKRIENLILFIIDNLYASNEHAKIPFYINLIKKFKGGYKYNVAKLIYNIFLLKSRRTVNFILYH